ncbi:hypothetical protein Golax_005483 [Gossypium laxum]|uniref:Uncharacterized protein n=1 Tax=Gossypium laxum TaxID=34288 RepID=A0A7J9A2A7_9ROSI|nr:hypothetical protein [Gossypium laxum]
MNTPIRLTVDKFGDLLHLPFGVCSSTGFILSYCSTLIEINSAILDAIHFLGNDVWGLRDDVNSRLSTLVTQMASLLARFPSTPPFSPSVD